MGHLFLTQQTDRIWLYEENDHIDGVGSVQAVMTHAHTFFTANTHRKKTTTHKHILARVVFFLPPQFFV